MGNKLSLALAALCGTLAACGGSSGDSSQLITIDANPAQVRLEAPGDRNVFRTTITHEDGTTVEESETFITQGETFSTSTTTRTSLNRIERESENGQFTETSTDVIHQTPQGETVLLILDFGELGKYAASEEDFNSGNLLFDWPASITTGQNVSDSARLVATGENAAFSALDASISFSVVEQTTVSTQFARFEAFRVLGVQEIEFLSSSGQCQLRGRAELEAYFHPKYLSVKSESVITIRQCDGTLVSEGRIQNELVESNI